MLPSSDASAPAGDNGPAMIRHFESLLPPRIGANRWDLLAGGFVLALIALFVIAGHQMRAPMVSLQTTPIALDPSQLPGYALRTVVRMFAAMACSLLFTFIVGTLAARDRRARRILLPLLDILQSVPVLGYLSFTVVLFLTLFPDSVVGAELRGHLRHLHQPGLEHDVQLLPVAAHGSR